MSSFTKVNSTFTNCSRCDKSVATYQINDHTKNFCPITSKDVVVIESEENSKDACDVKVCSNKARKSARISAKNKKSECVEVAEVECLSHSTQSVKNRPIKDGEKPDSCFIKVEYSDSSFESEFDYTMKMSRTRQRSLQSINRNLAQAPTIKLAQAQLRKLDSDCSSPVNRAEVKYVPVDQKINTCSTPQLLKDKKESKSNVIKNTGEVKIKKDLLNSSTGSSPSKKKLRIEELWKNTDIFPDLKPYNLDLDLMNILKDLIPKPKPYFLKNFLQVVHCVTNNMDDAIVFTTQEKLVMHVFCNLSFNAQVLYTKLFNSISKWIKVSKIKKSGLKDEDLLKAGKELIEYGFIFSEEILKDLSEVLDILVLPDLKELSKEVLCIKKSNLTTKPQIIKEIENLMKQKSFFISKESLVKNIFSKALKFVPHMYQMCSVRVEVFRKMYLLFSLHLCFEHSPEKLRAFLNRNLFLEKELGYPEYTCERKSVIYQSREEFQEFYELLQKYHQLLFYLENFSDEEHQENALQIFEFSSNEFWRQNGIRSQNTETNALPPFLKKYTPFNLLQRMVSCGVEALEKTKQYARAREELEKLLNNASSTKNPLVRGKWWDRLTLITDFHLKRPQEALDFCCLALKDENVSDEKRILIVKRYRALCRKQSCNIDEELLKSGSWEDEFELFDPTNGNEVCNSVQVLMKKVDSLPGQVGKSVFTYDELVEDADEDGLSGLGGRRSTSLAKTYCSVENAALRHYFLQGYSKGLHCEGAVFCSLTMILFWREIFSSVVKDAFRYSLQICPLDMESGEHFYKARKDMIDMRLDRLNGMTVEEFNVEFRGLWATHFGKLCLGVNWKLFSSLEEAHEFISCFKKKNLLLVCERIIKNYRKYRSGLPDLLVWSVNTMTAKLVEVKGPGDKLSERQRIWLHFLRCSGIDVEVCHVVSS